MEADWHRGPDVPQATGLSVDGLPSLGEHNAKLMLMEFADFECPYCIRHSTTVLPELQKCYIDSGKLQYFFTNFPLPVHPHAMLLATCSQKQRQFWTFHDMLFQTQP